jgi:hypothetical protein
MRVVWTAVLAGYPPQTLGVENMDELSANADTLGGFQFTEQAADRFEGKPQMVANFLTGQTEVELIGGKAAQAIAPGQIQQKSRQPLLCRALAENHALDALIHLLSGALQQYLLDSGQSLRHLLQVMRRQFAIAAGFEGYQRTPITARGHTVKAQQFAGQQ